MNKCSNDHIYQNYSVSLQSPSLHDQPLQMFRLLHATLQHNDYVSFSFLTTLWPCLKVKLIKASIKISSLVMFNIIPSLKESVYKHSNPSQN